MCLLTLPPLSTQPANSNTSIRTAPRSFKRAFAVAGFLLTTVFVQSLSAQTISLEQAMADPDWIGRPPQQPYWSDDNKSIYFTQKRLGSRLTDLYQMDRNGDQLTLLSASELPTTDVRQGVVSTNGRLKTYSREGDIFVKNLRSGKITQLTRTAAAETNPSFTADDSGIYFIRDSITFVRQLESGLEYQAAEIKSEKSPEQILAEAKPSYLESQQSRLFEIIKAQQQREIALREHREESQRSDSDRALLPFYVGNDEEILSTALSPNEKWMVVRLRNKKELTDGKPGSMPNYVTTSGYTENKPLRARVGTTDYANQRLALLDLSNHRQAFIDLSQLPGLGENSLLEQLSLNQESTDPDPDKETPKRTIRLQGLQWSKDGSQLLFHASTRDNKDRWILAINTHEISLSEEDETEFSASIELGDQALTVVHHDHDPAWVNRRFITAQWLPDNQSVIFHSEQDGYLHLYRWSGDDTIQLTSGNFEVHEPTVSRDGKSIFFRGNVNHPTIYEIFRVDIATQKLSQLTSLGGMNSFVLSPDEKSLLITHSEAQMPPELYIQRAKTESPATKLTETVSEQFKAINWAQVEFVEVDSSFTESPIHSRAYTPDNQSENRPAVIFIHGAGYLQNAHQGWSSYFREFMFHSFLVQQGYVVLDMDYRASLGYGREWRTAIYQQMGTPEVQDLSDGVDWLVENRNVDRKKICAYGGSYGGFLTLMSLFKEPELFACGAALRPVTDWATYNHGYTSNILNIPDLDPAAFERSSPIEFAEGLNKPLLIAHGMQDDNVFFQDSVRLVQRLIELEKENFEIAIYPIEPHGFREPSSWLDEYRRIFKLVNQTIGHSQQ
ncbi:MAG: prolyl oligopeptidase family serine peptidase [Pseudohongiellaceae bacterium]